MDTKPTPLALSIFSAIQGKNSRAVFLSEQNGNPVLGFGANSTGIVFYLIRLCWAGREIRLASRDHPTFAFLADCGGTHNSARLVLYSGNGPDPILEFGGDGEPRQLSGQIIVRAKDQFSDQQVVIHAVFGGDGANSIAIDTDPQFANHLVATAALLEGSGIHDLF